MRDEAGPPTAIRVFAPGRHGRSRLDRHGYLRRRQNLSQASCLRHALFVADRESACWAGGTPALVKGLAAVGAGFLGWWALVTFFSPRMRYGLRHCPAPDSPEFVHLLEWLCPARLLSGNRVSVLTNGDSFYPAMLDALAAVQRTINIEAYVFQRGTVLERFVAVLIDRANAGVEVTLVLDGCTTSSQRTGSSARARSCPAPTIFH